MFWKIPSTFVSKLTILVFSEFARKFVMEYLILNYHLIMEILNPRGTFLMFVTFKKKSYYFPFWLHVLIYHINIVYVLVDLAQGRYYWRALLNAAFPERDERFSTNVWNLRQPSFVKNLYSWWFLAVISVYKTKNAWCNRRADHKSSLNWLDDRPPLSVGEMVVMPAVD